MYVNSLHHQDDVALGYSGCAAATLQLTADPCPQACPDRVEAATPHWRMMPCQTTCHSLSSSRHCPDSRNLACKRHCTIQPPWREAQHMHRRAASPHPLTSFPAGHPANLGDLPYNTSCCDCTALVGRRVPLRQGGAPGNHANCKSCRAALSPFPHTLAVPTHKG